MRNWLEIDDKRKKQVYDQVAAIEGLPSFAVEKDFWLTLTLQTVFDLTWADQMVFKGGTSLSKGWDLIQRFSEDIDIAINRNHFGFDGRLGSSKRTRLRKRVRSFVMDELAPALSEKLRGQGADVGVKVQPDKNSDADPSIVEIEYWSLTEPSEYLSPKVLLEINARSLFQPFERRIIKPLISSLFPELNIRHTPVSIPCVLPNRTFFEKVFLLHEEFQKNEPEIRSVRLSRHLYDLERMMDTTHAEEAFSDEKLYTDIIEHRQHLTRISGIDYENHKPGNINLLPPDRSFKLWEADYKNMQESMIYGESLPFEKLMQRMTELMKRINALKF